MYVRKNQEENFQFNFMERNSGDTRHTMTLRSGTCCLRLCCYLSPSQRLRTHSFSMMWLLLIIYMCLENGTFLFSFWSPVFASAEPTFVDTAFISSSSSSLPPTSRCSRHHDELISWRDTRKKCTLACCFARKRLEDNMNKKQTVRSRTLLHSNTGNHATMDEGSKKIRRMDVRGVSVSPSGFLLLLSTAYREGGAGGSGGGIGGNDNGKSSKTPKSSSSSSSESSTRAAVTIPIRITSSSADAYATTSAESLTILQLLSGVDLAGAILPPDMLQKVVSLYCSRDEDNHSLDENDNVGKKGGKVVMVEDELGLLQRGNEENGGVNVRGIEDTAAREVVKDFLAKTLPEGTTYESANVWQRGRVKFPKMTLDSVRIDVTPPMVGETGVSEREDNGDSTLSVHTVPLTFYLDCTIEGLARLSVPLHSEWNVEGEGIHLEGTEPDLSSSILREVCYDYDLDTSGAFVSLALALRYRAPILIEAEGLKRLVALDSATAGHGSAGTPRRTFCLVGIEDEASIRQYLPAYKTLSSLRDASERVVKRIEKGFEVNKLQSALRIAMDRGDKAAIKKIRKELDKLDSFDDLPTTNEDEDGTGGGEGGVLE